MEGFGRGGFGNFKPNFANLAGNARNSAGNQNQSLVSTAKIGFTGLPQTAPGGFTGPPAAFARGQGRGQGFGFAFQGQNKDLNNRPSNRNTWSGGFGKKEQEKPQTTETSFKPSFGANPQFNKFTQNFTGFSNNEQIERYDRPQRFPKPQFLNKSESNEQIERPPKQNIKDPQERPSRQNRAEIFERQEKPERSENIKIRERKYENPKSNPENDQQDLDKTEKALRQKALNTFNMIKRKKQVPESKLIKSDFSSHKIDPEAKIVKSKTSSALSTEKLKPSSQDETKPVQSRPPMRSSTNKSFDESSPSPKLQKPASKSFKPLSKPQASSALSFKMCSEEESKSREESNQLSIFERIPGTTQYKSEWTVKKYLRSSADRADYKRDAEDLSMTLNYLITQILDVDSNGNPNSYEYQEGCESHSYQDIYPFLFDRMRAVLKDWKILNSNESDEYVKDHEMIARFLIMSCVEGLVCESFNLNLNLKLAEDVLTCLAKVYEKRRKLGIECPNQAEFLCYLIITKPDNMLIIVSMLKGLPDELVNSKYLQLAIYLLTCYQNSDFEEFFNTVYEAPYLVACAAYPLFHKIRIAIFDVLISQKVDQVEFGLFREIFALYDEDEARMYIQEFELELIEDTSGETLIVSLEPIQEKLRNRNFSVLPSEIQSKNKLETRLQVISTAEEFESPDSEAGSISDEEPAASPKKAIEVPEPIKKPQITETTQVQQKKPETFQIPEKPLQIESNPIKLQTPDPAPSKLSLFQSFTPPASTNSLFSLKPDLPTSTFPLVKAEECKSAPPAPVKEVKKLNFEFPFDDKQFFSIVKDKKTKERIKENIRNYRMEKKLREKSKKRQIEILIKMKVFNAWKTVLNQRKLEKYFENRKLKEMEAFKLQFSDLIISDAVNFQRYLAEQDAVRI